MYTRFHVFLILFAEYNLPTATKFVSKDSSLSDIYSCLIYRDAGVRAFLFVTRKRQYAYAFPCVFVLLKTESCPSTFKTIPTIKRGPNGPRGFRVLRSRITVFNA